MSDHKIEGVIPRWDPVHWREGKMKAASALFLACALNSGGEHRP